jgi:hypothetical protein
VIATFNLEIIDAIKRALQNGITENDVVGLLLTKDDEPGLPLILADAIDYVRQSKASLENESVIAEQDVQLDQMCPGSVEPSSVAATDHLFAEPTTAATDPAVESASVSDETAESAESAAVPAAELVAACGFAAEGAGTVKASANKKLSEVPNPPTAYQIAEKYIKLGGYVWFAPRGAKGCTETGWQNLATRDLATAKAAAGDGCKNVMLVGKRDGIWALDVDDPTILEDYEKIHGRIPSRRHRSVSGGLHLIFLPSEAAWQMGNTEEANDDDELFSVRVDNRYVLLPGSVAYPDNDTKNPLTFYEATDQSPLTEIPLELIEFLKARISARNKVTGNKGVDASLSGPKIPHGSHDNMLFKIGCKLRQIGLEEDGITNQLVEICEKRCENYGSDYQDMCRNKARQACKYPPGTDAQLIISGSIPPLTASVNEPKTLDLSEEIPAFDPSVITGIYGEIVELITRGTTLDPQFAFLAAKVVIGAKMAGRVQFENLDAEPRYYGAAIAETGAGKGEAWRRMEQILNAQGSLIGTCGIKITNSADSGAGIRDLFFEPPEEQPVLCYVDEVSSLGNKGADTRNPGILDTIVELADSTRISRTKAKKKGDMFSGAKTKNDARFCMYMCGQDGDTYMKAFAGRTKLGMWDRLYPEYGTAVEAGDMPPIHVADAYKLLGKINQLAYSGMMTMTPEAKTRFDQFWASQPKDVRSKARWKKNVMMDAYMAGFGRGSKQAEIEDMEIAIRIFTRQLVIRQICFRGEVPDRIGFYYGKIKELTAQMERQLKGGMAREFVALSRRDFEKQTHAHRDNETHIFERAWKTYQPTWLEPFKVKKANGQEYVKYLPGEDE